MHYSAGKFQINQFQLTVCKERIKIQLEAQMAINYYSIIIEIQRGSYQTNSVKCFLQWWLKKYG